MQRSTLILGVLVLVAALLIVLDRPEPQPAGVGLAAPGAPLPEGHPPLNSAAPSAAAATEGPFATVLETLDSGGYTYARVETGSEGGESAEIWVAGPVTPLTVGQQVSLAGAMGMENFRAASLDRTFDAILFVGRFAGPGTGAPGADVGSQPPGADAGTVVEVAHSAGYSYILVEREGVREWVAGNQIEVSEGQTVTWDGGTVMQAFQSPSLGRTFDRILFADGLRVRQ